MVQLDLGQTPLFSSRTFHNLQIFLHAPLALDLEIAGSSLWQVGPNFIIQYKDA